MKRKAFTNLSEAAKQVWGGTAPESEIDEAVLEYFDNYFDGELNEDTFDGDIIDAVKDLILLTEAVCEAVGLDEKVINS